MKKYKRVVAIITGLLMCMSILAACGPSGSAPTQSGNTNTPQGGASTAPDTSSPSVVASAPEDPEVKFADHIEVLLETALAVVNPHSPSGTGKSPNMAYHMVYDHLVHFDDESFTFVPNLATDWVTDDWKTFVFDLRNDVYWHNGDKFTAQDIANTIRMAKEAVG